MARQYPLENWHFSTPYPASGPMSREVRDWWCDARHHHAHREIIIVPVPAERERGGDGLEGGLGDGDADQGVIAPRVPSRRTRCLPCPFLRPPRP